MNRIAGLEEVHANGFGNGGVSHPQPELRAFAAPIGRPVPESALKPVADILDDDDVEQARAAQYALLASLLLRAPDAETLTRLTRLQGTPTPLGLANIGLAEAAGAASAASAQREFFELFIGVGRGELLPYASYYLTGFLSDRPLARLRQDLGELGLERADGHPDPEDHLGTLFEIMSGFAGRTYEVSAEVEERFFSRHIAPWAGRFFADLELAKSARFYKAVGRLGQAFMAVEMEAFAVHGAAAR